MIPRKHPTTTIIRALSMDPLERYVIIENPKNIRLKYSGGPNPSATLAKVGAKKKRMTIPMIPAMKEPKAEIPRAGPARPCRAI